MNTYAVVFALFIVAINILGFWLMGPGVVFGGLAVMAYSYAAERSQAIG